jgi:hypothetical protein
MIKSNLSCPKCGLEQSRFNFECKKCGFFLRDKVPNIDLGTTLAGLVDSPSESFDKIVFSENKNFASFFLVFAMIKFYFIAIFFSFHFFDYSGVEIMTGYLQFLLLLSLSLLLPYILKVATPLRFSGVRWRDITSGFSYALAPIALSAAFLIFLEVIIYGEFLFSHSPSPLDFKQMFGVIFSILEAGFIIWSISLMAIFFFRLGMGKILSTLISIKIFLLLTLFAFLIINFVTPERLGF